MAAEEAPAGIIEEPVDAREQGVMRWTHVGTRARGNPGESPFSARRRRFVALSVGCLLLPLRADAQHSPAPIRGSVDTLYSHFEDEEESSDRIIQQWNLLWEDLMPNGDRLDLDFTGSWETTSEQDGIDVFPSIGALLRSDRYRLRTRYSRFINRDFFQGDGKQVQDRWEIDLLLLRFYFDEIRLYIEDTRVEDDFDPHLVDTETRQAQVGFVHEFEDLAYLDRLRITGEHWQEEFENNAASQARVPFVLPVGLTVRGSNVYVVDAALGQVVVLTTNLTFIRTIGDGLTGVGRLQDPRGVAVDAEGRVYVSDSGSHRIVRFLENGVFDRFWGFGIGSAEGQFNRPLELAVDPDGAVYVADSGNRRIQRLLPGADEFATFVTGGLIEPTGVAADRLGRLYVVDRSLNRVLRYSAAGTLELSWGVPGAGQGEFNAPVSVTVDDNFLVYVADTNNGRIQKFTDNGNFITEWGNDPASELLRTPQGVAAAPAFIFVSDTGNGLVRKYDTGGGLIQSSVGGRVSSRKTTDDSFAANFSTSPAEWWNVFGSYEVHRLDTEHSDGSETETWTNDAALQTTFDVADFWRLSGGGTLRYLEIDRREALDTLPPTFRTTGFDELDVTAFASALFRLREEMQLGLSHTGSRSYDNGDETAANRRSSAFLGARAWGDVFLDVRGSHNEIDTGGERTSETDSFGYSVRGPLVEDTFLIWNHDVSYSTIFSDAGDREIESQIAKLDVNSRVARRTRGRISYVYTQTATDTEERETSSDFHSVDLEMTQDVTPFVYVTGGVRHNLGRPEDVSEWLFTGTLGWRWAERYNLLLTYADFQDGTRTRNFSSRLTVRLRGQSRIELTYENFDERDVGTTQLATARLVLAF